MIRLWDEQHIKVVIKWVPGKSDPYTKRVDRLAKQSAGRTATRQDVPTRVRRKWSPRSVEADSVTMRGQEDVIRVITDQYLRTQRVLRVKYEVIDARSRDFQCVDFAFTDHMLSAGHLYRVRFNDNAAYPQILEVLEEFPMETYRLENYRAGHPGPWEENPK
jgi:hypothetical protein